MHLYFTLLLLSACAMSYSQQDSLDFSLEKEIMVESFMQDQAIDEEFNYNDLFDELSYLRRNPLNLNAISPNDLNQFPFLSPLQKTSLVGYLLDHGPLLSVFELQAIPFFDLQTIKNLLPFVTIGQSTFDPLPDNWSAEGNHQIIMRWSRTLEQKRGFEKNENEQRPYAGDPNQWYLRYRFTFSNRLSFGFTAEKDEGETFFNGSNSQGFDFYSGHFFLQNPNGKLRAVAVGDFSISMGQGLILFNGFSTRKGPQTIQVKRLGQVIRRYSSVNETDFFRGAGVTVSLSKTLQFTPFISSKKQDANIEEEMLENESAAVFATSLQNSGKHRTESEIMDEKAVRQTAIGGILTWSNRHWQISLNTLYNRLGKNLKRTSALYNQYFFAGRQLFNSSFDYSYTWRNIHFFGETAASEKDALASANGVLISLDPKLDIALLHRHFPRNYQALNPKPFAETTGARNESGLYLGLELTPLPQWKVNVYFDQWRHPWLRFRSDAPSKGHEWLTRINYKIRRKMEAHFQIKNEVKMENTDAPDGRFDRLHLRKNVQGRIHLSYQLTKSLEWRSRAYAGFTEINGERLKGTAMFQDLKFKAIGFPISFTARYAIFDTEDYAIRFYAYENDVLNSFTVPAYFDRGSRFFLLVGLRFRNGLLLETRVARTSYVNQQTIGSGNDEIDGTNKTDLKVQLRWNF
ncbi:MAG: helix-hairpin-helix domain-containing protein [Bacteroidota bacterium]